jgi:RAQPRD family integrative conjugative element protein
MRDQRAKLRLSMLTGTLVAAALAALLPAASADADAEREALARLAHEMESLEPLVRQAESQAEPDVRIRFRYEWLRHDLARVRQGIEGHLSAPRSEPRTFPPLRGDYRR